MPLATPTAIPPLATPDDLVAYFDWRWVAENILDTKPPSAATLAQVLASPVVARMLQCGTEELVAAAGVGGRYTPDDLSRYGGELAKKLTCYLAAGPILGRRDRPAKSAEALSLAYDAAMAQVEQIRAGERVFVLVPDVLAAGAPSAPPVVVPGVSPVPLSAQAGRIFGWPQSGFGPNGGW